MKVKNSLVKKFILSVFLAVGFLNVNLQSKFSLAKAFGDFEYAFNEAEKGLKKEFKKDFKKMIELSGIEKIVKHKDRKIKYKDGYSKPNSFYYKEGGTFLNGVYDFSVKFDGFDAEGEKYKLNEKMKRDKLIKMFNIKKVMGKKNKNSKSRIRNRFFKNRLRDRFKKRNKN